MTVQALHSRALWLYENDSADWLLGMQVAYEDFVVSLQAEYRS